MKFQNAEFVVEEASNADIVNFLITKHRQEKRKNYSIQKLKEDKETATLQIGEESITFELFFFYNKEHSYNKTLKDFCTTFVKPEAEIFNAASNIISSILFIASGRNIFVVTTGQGFRIIEDFCVSKFGMKFLSAHFESIKIAKTDANRISGAEHSARIIYGQDVSFVNIDKLDTIYKEITGKTTDSQIIRTLLALDATSKKKSLNIVAKNFLQLGSSLTLDKLLNLLANIDVIDISTLDDSFNSILSLSDKHDKEQIEKNNLEVMRVLHQAKDTKHLSFDIFNYDADQFIEGDKFIIHHIRGGATEIENNSREEFAEAIFSAYETHLGDDEDSFSLFCDFIKKTRIITAKDDYSILDDTLLNHVSGEISIDGKNYYILYGKYYLINESYTNRLNSLLGAKLASIADENVFETNWDGSEDKFNKDASEQEDYAHLHKVLIENIEFADLIKFGDDFVQIVHVKECFDGNMRILERQIELSMIKLNDLRRNNQEEFFRKLYQKSNEKDVGKKLSEFFENEDEFIQALKNKAPTFIMALKTNIDFNTSNSNIAKLCLLSLIDKAHHHACTLTISRIEEGEDESSH